MGMEKDIEFPDSVKTIASTYEILGFVERKLTELYKDNEVVAVEIPLSFAIGTIQYIMSVMMNGDIEEMVDFSNMMLPRMTKLIQKYEGKVDGKTH